jgi:hypothetical protein
MGDQKMENEKSINYPPFVEKERIEINRYAENRYSLKIPIGKNKENIIVIMKNPSTADEKETDRTIHRVLSYIHKSNNEILKDIGTVIILNLMPIYLTESKDLKNEKESNQAEWQRTEKENLEVIEKFCKKKDKVIVAWGNHPAGLKKDYDRYKKNVLDILKRNGNKLFYVGKLSKEKNPKHGQIWGYENKLVEIKISEL